MPRQKASRSLQKNSSSSFPFQLRIIVACAGMIVFLILICGHLAVWRCDADEAVRSLMREVSDLKRHNALLELQLEHARSDPGKSSNSFLAPQEVAPAPPAPPAPPVPPAPPAPEPPAKMASRPAGFTEDDVHRLQMLAGKGAVGVMLIVCKRPNLFEKAMTSILRATRDAEKFPIIVSQDDYDSAMSTIVQNKYARAGTVFHMQHAHQQDAKAISKKFGGSKTTLGYVYIAQHYGFVMRTMFDEVGFDQLIFLEEDLQISPDFFSYFDSMLPILHSDSDLFCVSAWNDNGIAKLVKSPQEVFRTDFFPGLGWMMQKSMWSEIRDRWASAYWDEFMRRPDVRKGRQCIRPEISRTYTIGYTGGTSKGQFKDHLSEIMLNTENVDWKRLDLSFLSSTLSFERYLEERLRAARLISHTDPILQQPMSVDDEMRIIYSDKAYEWETISNGAACEQNSQGISRMKGLGGHDLTSCKTLCSSTVGCTAVDFFQKTKWCNLFANACTNPLKVGDGSSSYRRKADLHSDVEYKIVAKHFSLMPDEKEGIRRMSFRGVIPFVWKERHVFLYTRNWPEGLS